MTDRKHAQKKNIHIANIQGLRVCLVCELDEQTNDWIQKLRLARVEVTHIWPPPRGRLSLDMDILICDYFPQMGDLIPWIPGDMNEGALVILLPVDGKYDDGVVLSSAPQCVLQRPSSGELVCTTLKVAWSQFRYSCRLLDRVSRLDENVRSVRGVERAKRIIMNDQGIDEAAAYKYLRDLAMRQQQTVSEVAASLIS